MITENLGKTAQTHELKADPIPFDDVLYGRKMAEVRFDDRGFRAGDVLHLRETLDDRKTYTGRELHRTISHIQRGYGLPPNVVVLSLAAHSADARNTSYEDELARSLGFPSATDAIVEAAFKADASNAVLHTEDDGEIGDSVESIVACLGDDAAMIRDEYPEVAANMDKAAEILEVLAREV